jgi:hypothetical protein
VGTTTRLPSPTCCAWYGHVEFCPMTQQPAMSRSLKSSHSSSSPIECSARYERQACVRKVFSSAVRAVANEMPLRQAAEDLA